MLKNNEGGFSRVWRGCITAIGLISALAPTPACSAAGGPVQSVRAASINLCADQYLLSLAGPGQILSVTYLAADPARSAEWRAAAWVPVNRGSAEEIAVLRPDLVLADGYSDPATVSLVRRLGVAVVALDDPSDFAGIAANMRRVAAALGREERGEDRIAGMNALLGARSDGGATRPVVAMLEPGGYTEGSGTLVDEAIERAGGIGLGRVLGLQGYATLPLERLVAAPVDLLLVADNRERSASLGSAFLHHPAIAARFRDTPRLALPSTLLDCASPDSAALVPLIRGAVERLQRGRRPAGGSSGS
jgi:iron complex transport system substrate-binding protein